MTTKPVDEKKMANYITHWIAQSFALELEKAGYKELAIKFKNVSLKNGQLDFRGAYRAYRAYRADLAYLAYLVDLTDLADRADLVDLAYLVDRAEDLVGKFIDAYVYAGGKRNTLNIKKLNTKILLGIENEKFILKQDSWHGHNSCGSTHCRAGYTTVLMGAAGIELEKLVGTSMAAAMCSMVSTGTIPNYYNMDNDAVLEDIKACAALE